MSTSRKLVGALIVLAALGMLRLGNGQAIGGGPVGSIVAHDLADLAAFGEWLRHTDLRRTLDPALASGAAVTSMRFQRFFDTNGSRLYLGDLTTSDGTTWSCVQLVPSSGASVTRVRMGSATGSTAMRAVISDSTSVDFLASLTQQPPPVVQQALAAEFVHHKLTGIRVTAVSSMAGRASSHTAELFFDGQDQAPSLSVTADFSSIGFSNFRVNK